MKFTELSSAIPTVAGTYWMTQGGHTFHEDVQIIDGVAHMQDTEGTWVPISQTQARTWGLEPIPRPS